MDKPVIDVFGIIKLLGNNVAFNLACSEKNRDAIARLLNAFGYSSDDMDVNGILLHSAVWLRNNPNKVVDLLGMNIR